MNLERDLAARRKRLRFRCWHRGSREADLLLGPFADSHIHGFDAARLSWTASPSPPSTSVA